MESSQSPQLARGQPVAGAPAGRQRCTTLRNATRKEGVYDASQYEFRPETRDNLLLEGRVFFRSDCITHKTTRTESNPLRGSNWT